MNAKEARKKAYENQLEIIKTLINNAINAGKFSVRVPLYCLNASAQLYLSNMGYTITTLDRESVEIGYGDKEDEF